MMITLDQTALSELEETLQPLVDLLNRRYRGEWEHEFRFCDEPRFRPLNDADCALIELPLKLGDYPDIEKVLRDIVIVSEGCLHHYRERPEGDGPVCGPCRFSVQYKAFSDDGCSYVNGNHLVVERRDPNGRAAERQIAYIYREIRDFQGFGGTDRLIP